MAWISVHQEVDGSKLRRLYRMIGCSKFEALGILNFLWFWGLKNADETGLIKEADKDVLARYLYGCGDGSNVDMKLAAQALIDTGWVEQEGDDLRLHDWDTWQEQWYKYQRTKEYNAERKRKERKAEKEKRELEKKEDAPVGKPKSAGEKTEPEKEDEPKKPKKPEKKKYADFVHMPEQSYERLVLRYSKEFADECIRVLDNYKGSKGKRYADDYRAILNWVVDRVREKRPDLWAMTSEASSEKPISSNPFKEWSDGDGCK